MNQFESYILVVFHQTPLVHTFPSHSLYISNILTHIWKKQHFIQENKI